MEKTILEGANEFENGTTSTPEEVLKSSNIEVEKGFELNLDWLKTPTGEGQIEDYIDHPLNFLKSKGFAQILRGATGFFGNLKLAVLDIALGAFQFFKERKTGNG